MKELQKAIVILSSILLLGTTASWIETSCKRADKEHADKNVTRCPYSQSDLLRAHKKTPDRCSEDTCFFCGCPKTEHSES